MSVRALALWAGLVVAGCGSTTEIVLVVDSDLPAARVDTFWIRVSGAEARCFSVPASEAELPLTLGLVPSADEQLIEVTAAAFAGAGEVPPCEASAPVGGGVVVQRARARFVRGERRVLFMTLEAACSGQLCGEETSCREGRCQSVDRALDPWTGELPRIRPDAGAPDGGMDGGLDGGVDAGRPDAATDAGPPDGGTDAGPDGGPCDGVTPTVATLDPIADTELAPLECTDCGGSNDGGKLETLNIGFARPLLRYRLPSTMPVRELLSRLVDARVLLRRLRGHSACPSCAFDGELEARPMTNAWVEGEGESYTGATWCRRSAGGGTSCARWVADGADGIGTDVAGPSTSIFVSASDDEAELPMDLEAVRSFAWDEGELSVQLRGRRSAAGDRMQVVFLSASTDIPSSTAAPPPPRLRLSYCP